MLPHPVERLQVELLGALCRDELHRWALHRFGDCLRIAEVVPALSSRDIRIWLSSTVRREVSLRLRWCRRRTPPCRSDTAVSIWPRDHFWCNTIRYTPLQIHM